MNVDNIDVKKYKRFFSFGCSFTQYIWPTWADLIGREIPYYENWGKLGCGNQYIMNSVVECDIKHKFTETDLVIIMWTSTAREDRYIDGKWIGTPSNQFHERFGKEWTSKYGFDERPFMIRDYAFIDATQNFLRSKNCDWLNGQALRTVSLNFDYLKNLVVSKETNMLQLDSDIKYALLNLSYGILTNELKNYVVNYDVIEFYKRIFNNMPVSFIDTVFDPLYGINPSPDRFNFGDPHPTPLESLSHINKIFKNNLDQNDALRYCNEWNDAISRITVKNKVPKEFNQHLPDRI